MSKAGKLCQCQHRFADHNKNNFNCIRLGCGCEFFSPAMAASSNSATNEGEKQEVAITEPGGPMEKIDFLNMMEKDHGIMFSDFKPSGSQQKTAAVLTACIRLNGKIALKGLPKSFEEAYAALAKSNDDGAQFKAFMDHRLENMHLEFYLTPDSKRATLAVDLAKIDSFRLEKDKGEPDSDTGRKRPPSDIFLWFKVTFDVGNSRDAQHFTWSCLGSEFWWTAEVGQAEMEFAGAEAGAGSKG